jgi:glycosyltransferase involved in cell wall biosynthesis
VVALTKGDADEWRKLTPNVCVIPNVVHLNDSGIYGDCTAKSVIFVGRFSKQKDIGSLLRIWTLVHQRHSDWCLHIYNGCNEEMYSLIDEIRKIDANIQIHDPTSDIIERYKESSILILTSCFEPFGLVLPEAMSCGLPVVAFDCPYGPADIITDGVDGFLIQNSNIELFADKVCSLMDNVVIRLQMGQAGLQSSKRYSAEDIMPQWKSLFEQISIKS